MGIEEIKLVRGRDRINAVVFDGQEWEVDFLIWTAPITKLARLLDLPVPRLHYLKIAMFNIELNRQLDQENQWVYFGDKNLAFSRISFPKNFYAGNVPAGRDSLCVETTLNDEALWRDPRLLEDRIVADLEKIGLIRKEDIQNIHLERIEDAYPVYTLDYQEELAAVNNALARFKNLQCTGRTGLFWYNNMDESIEKGLKLAEAVIDGRHPTSWRWWQEGI
jgi:protoporphyrinogen oxidase